MATHSSILAWRIPRTEDLVSYSPRGCRESDTTERLTLSFAGNESYQRRTEGTNVQQMLPTVKGTETNPGLAVSECQDTAREHESCHIFTININMDRSLKLTAKIPKKNCSKTVDMIKRSSIKSFDFKTSGLNVAELLVSNEIKECHNNFDSGNHYLLYSTEN